MSKTQLYLKEKRGTTGGQAFLAVNHSQHIYVDGNTKGTAVAYNRMSTTVYVKKASEITEQKRYLKARGYRNVTANVFNKNI